MAYGGNFYAIADAASAGLEVRPEQAEELVEAGLALMAAVEEPVHPEDPDIRGCRHVVWTAPGADGADSRSATAIHPGWVDRSPCGTGTSARMAQLWSRGELALGAPFVNEGIIGTRFTGRLLEETTVGGRPAAVPEITGRAWITGMGQYLLDPEDPFPHGFRWGDAPDAIVVGAGICGASAAFFLQERGLEVLLLDRGAVAGGTTGVGEGNVLVCDKRPGAERELALTAAISGSSWGALPGGARRRARARCCSTTRTARPRRSSSPSSRPACRCCASPTTFRWTPPASRARWPRS